jgi:hypothetical protein
MLDFSALRIPDEWDLLVGVDTGTFMSAVIVAISPDPYEALVLHEAPNYRYVGDGSIELLGLSIGQWSHELLTAWHALRPGEKCRAWCDANTQFATEFLHHGLILLRNPRQLEVRTEITREYFQHNKVRLAPWLTVLPYELQHARWPPDVNAAGHYRRLKEKDHTLDPFEHVLSRRPRSKRLRETEKPKSFAEQWLETHRDPFRSGRRDVHLGPN